MPSSLYFAHLNFAFWYLKIFPFRLFPETGKQALQYNLGIVIFRIREIKSHTKFNWFTVLFYVLQNVLLVGDLPKICGGSSFIMDVVSGNSPALSGTAPPTAPSGDLHDLSSLVLGWFGETLPTKTIFILNKIGCLEWQKIIIIGKIS